MDNSETRRAQEMLHIAAAYIRKYCDDEIWHYDETDCDGACIADDCEFAAEAIGTTITHNSKD